MHIYGTRHASASLCACALSLWQVYGRADGVLLLPRVPGSGQRLRWRRRARRRMTWRPRCCRASSATCTRPSRSRTRPSGRAHRSWSSGALLWLKTEQQAHISREGRPKTSCCLAEDCAGALHVPCRTSVDITPPGMLQIQEEAS